MEKIYVNEQIQVFHGKEAESFLSKTNDLKFFDETEKGVHNVTYDRWLLAQKYERKTWMSDTNVSNDRNYEHLRRFDNLEIISDIKITNMIELGCGPFTNMRLMSKILNPKNITLVDPLIDDYLNHPNCSYKNGVLNGKSVNLLSTPIEKLEDVTKYDAVVMVNVIEHCYSVDTIFDKIINLLNTGGVLIFSDVYFKNARELVSNVYDAGHPLRLSEQKLESFLKNFDSLFDNRVDKLYSQDWRSDIYFIGKKK